MHCNRKMWRKDADGVEHAPLGSKHFYITMRHDPRLGRPPLLNFSRCTEVRIAQIILHEDGVSDEFVAAAVYFIEHLPQQRSLQIDVYPKGIATIPRAIMDAIPVHTYLCIRGSLPVVSSFWFPRNTLLDTSGMSFSSYVMKTPPLDLRTQQLVITLTSPRLIPHIGRRSPLKDVPVEIIREIIARLLK